MKKRKFKLSLFTMLILLSLLPLILSIAIISAISLYITKSNLEKDAKERLYVVANNLAVYCQENEINAINVGNYYEYIDSLKDQNIEMAIILEGTPSATSIKNENDYRIREIEFEKDIVADREEIENGYYDEYVLIDEKVYYAYYMPIKADGENMGMAFAGELQEHVTGATRNIIITYVGIAVVLILLFAVIMLVFSRGLLKSFQAVGKGINTLSKGDLSRQKETGSAVKEMNVLLLETNQMQKNMSATIGEVKKVSQKLVGSISEVTGLSGSSFARAKQITSAMEELSVSTMGMAENVQDIHTQMLEIGNCVNDISERVEHLFSSSENILKTNNEARADMDVILKNSKESVEAVTDILTQINQTNDSIEEIDKAVELILNISEQTKLLSLNASIEAARAGAHGRGFAVVAEEIRNLSEQSAEGAEMIKNLAGTITEKSHKSVQLADGVYTLIRDEQQSVSKTQEKYEELGRDIDRSVNSIRSIAEKTGNLTDYKERVIENVQSLSAISEENSASNEEVHANISEITTEVQIVSENCERMNFMAKELENSVAYFHD